MIKLKPRTKFWPMHVRLPMLNGRKCGIFLRMRGFMFGRAVELGSAPVACVLCDWPTLCVSFAADFVDVLFTVAAVGSVCVRVVDLLLSVSSHSTPESDDESDSERMRFDALLSFVSLPVKAFLLVATGTYSRKRSGLNCSGCFQYRVLVFSS